jgi:NAD(P)-dependent dehydrogenase (short-subunit alcohol dehydrogenase family)
MSVTERNGTALITGASSGIGAVYADHRAEWDAFDARDDRDSGFKDVAQLLHNTGKQGDRIPDEPLTNVYGLRGNKICGILPSSPMSTCLTPSSSEEALHQGIGC